MSMNSKSAGTSAIKLHANDFSKFGNVAFLLSEKSGFMLKQGAVNTYSLKKRFFVLYASLLYYFETDEPDSCVGVIFVESSTITIPNIGNESTSFDHIEYSSSRNGDGVVFKDFNGEEFFPFVITTIGGKKCPLFASSSQERDNWIDALLSGQRGALRRRIDELSQHSKTQESIRLEAGISEKRATLARSTLVKEIDILSKENNTLRHKMEILDKDFKAAMSRLETSEAERITLLTANGIIPKANPVWAQPTIHQISRLPDVGKASSPRGTEIEHHSLSTVPRQVQKKQDTINSQTTSALVLRMWVGTWNMGACPLPPPFTTSQRNDLSYLHSFVTPGYDIYAVGVQECVGDSFLEAMRNSVSSQGVYQIDLHQSLEEGGRVQFHRPSDSTTSPMKSRGSNPERVTGRGDGSLISTKYTGIAIYLHERFEEEVTVLSVAKFAFSPVTSKGGAAVALSFAGRTVVFASCHLEAHHDKVELRREQYRTLVIQLGSALAEEGFHLNEQFHHIIWVGDMNYRLCVLHDDQESYLPMSSDTAQLMLENSQNRVLFNKHDQFNLEKRRREIFYGYREANPFPNFFPTYKKIENRPPVNFSDPAWVKDTYRLKYKEPFYKGGNVKERTPGFCDRILFHSTPDLAESLVPETVYVNLDISHPPTLGPGLEVRNSDQLKLSPADQDHSKLTKVVDNYQSVLEGIPFTLSDHSPVFCTFLLRIENYVDRVLRRKAYLKWRLSQEKDTRDYTDTIFSDESGDLDDDEFVASSHILYPNIKNPSEDISSCNSQVITLSDFSLICGSTELCPCGIRLVFPLPFEVPHGEEFVSLAQLPDELQQCTTSVGVDLFQNYPRKIKSNTAGWSTIPSDTKSCMSVKYCQSYDAQVLGQAVKNDNKSHDSIYDLASSVDPISMVWAHPTVPLDELHIALRVAVPAAVISSSSQSTSTRRSISGGRNKSSSSDRDLEGSISFMEQNDDTDYMIGHCSIGLNRLCQTAAAAALSKLDVAKLKLGDDMKGHASGVVSSSVSAASILIKDGRPLYNIDLNSMQREVVTLCCKLTLTQPAM